MKHPETFEQEMKINDNEGPSSFFKLKKSALCKHFQNSVNWAIWLGLSFDHAPYDPKTQKKKIALRLLIGHLKGHEVIQLSHIYIWLEGIPEQSISLLGDSNFDHL
jgi:hypothetical protein